MNYLVLLNIANKNEISVASKTASKVMANLKNISKHEPKIAWADGAYFGIAIEFDGAAADIWFAITQGINEGISLKDLLIIELGRDWMCRNEAAAHGWLNSHLGAPLPCTSKFGRG